ncbi:hypothetical protein [Ruminococcus sp.]|uniref:hypothetical protein n=1 Tax=Ruminococcus sp. TaxID=41978 RepID=UPI002EA551B0|nr:hypothetical protein [Ruminococcus sp.]
MQQTGKQKKSIKIVSRETKIRIDIDSKNRAAGELKSFSVQQFFKNAAEVWASSPHLRSKLYLQSVFPAAIAFFGTVQFK